MGEPERPDNDRDAPPADAVMDPEQVVDELEERVLGRPLSSRREDQEEGDSPAFEQDLDEGPPERGPGAEPS